MHARANSFIAPDMFSAGPAAWPFGDLVPQAYDFVMCDPPWHFENYSEAGQVKGPEPHYRTMSDAEILSLPVADLARENCGLWLWATAPKLDLAFEVLRAWGFEYVTFGTWDKVRWGTGYVLRSLGEPYLIGKRGNPKLDGRSVPNLIRESRREHSRKPESAYRNAEQLMPAARRADLFSRQSRRGWESFGADAGKFDLAEDDLTAEQIESEVKRADAIVQVADRIVDNARLHLQACKLIADHGDRFQQHLPMISGPEREPGQ